jgi:dynactin 1
VGRALQLAHATSAYISDIRTTKDAFKLSAFHAFVKDIAATELGKETGRPLDEICALLAQLTQDVGTTLSTAMDSNHVVKRECLVPSRSRE